MIENLIKTWDKIVLHKIGLIIYAKNITIFFSKMTKKKIDVDILIELQNLLVDYCDNNNNN